MKDQAAVKVYIIGELLAASGVSTSGRHQKRAPDIGSWATTTRWAGQDFAPYIAKIRRPAPQRAHRQLGPG
jgi:hypothetical protein